MTLHKNLTRITSALLLAATMTAHAQESWADFNRRQHDIYFNHILPNMQGGGYAPQEQVVYESSWSYRHYPQYVAYAIGTGPATAERHGDGHMHISFDTAETDYSMSEGWESRESAHKDAFETCDLPNCRVIAEAGNTCMAVISATVSTYNLDEREREAYIDRHGVDGTFYVRHYFAYLEPHERGDAQADVDGEQKSKWRHMLRERAHALCEADGAGNPLHKCEDINPRDNFSVCAIDEIKVY